MTTQIQPATVQSLPAIFWHGQPVITTELLASVYETEANNIKQNYKRNINRFTEGTHYFKITGKELRGFREVSDNLSLSPNTPSLMLWTERGTVRHAKMLGTDKRHDHVMRDIKKIIEGTKEIDHAPKFGEMVRRSILHHVADASNMVAVVAACLTSIRAQAHTVLTTFLQRTSAPVSHCGFFAPKICAQFPMGGMIAGNTRPERETPAAV